MNYPTISKSAKNKALFSEVYKGKSTCPKCLQVCNQYAIYYTNHGYDTRTDCVCGATEYADTWRDITGADNRQIITIDFKKKYLDPNSNGIHNLLITAGARNISSMMCWLSTRRKVLKDASINIQGYPSVIVRDVKDFLSDNGYEGYRYEVKE